MSYLTQLFSPRPKAADMSVNDERAWVGMAGMPTSSGVTVTADTALKISTVWACVGLISDAVAMLPTVIYEIIDQETGDKRRAREHPLYDLLHDQPNANQTAFDYKKMQTAHLLLRGNSYAYIQPGPRGFADQLIPLHPDKMRTEDLPDGRLRYVYTQPVGGPRTYTDDEIMHLRGLTLDGKTGLGVVSHARETMGTAVAREQYGARFFGNNSRPDGVLKTAGKLSTDGAKRMADDWNSVHQGVGKSHRVAVLEEGLEYQAIGLSNRDSQFLELGEFSAEEIAGRWFRVPPHMVGLTSKATSWGSGIEEMSLGFITFTLMPWLTIWEQGIGRDLILATRKYYARFVREALLMGRLLDRYNAYSIARNNGWLSVNEIRRREDLNGLSNPGADEYLKPLNMTNLDDDGAGAVAPSVPAAAMPADMRSAATVPTMAEAGHYGALLRESAGRVVRKEIAAVARISRRHPESSDPWKAEVREFYASHADHVAQTLCISPTAAGIYVAEQVRELSECGAGLMADWETRRVADLVHLVMEAA